MSARRSRRTLDEVLGPLEAEVMDVVWAEDEVTVRDVHEALNRKRKLAYTTVMTTMTRLADKGLLSRVEDHPAHRFSARVTREQYASSTVRSVVDWLVEHFRDPAVAYFIDRVGEDDLDSLMDAIEQKKATGKR
jgi:predicted transcriptional regulator